MAAQIGSGRLRGGRAAGAAVAAVAVVAGLLASGPPGTAAFPGDNGRIAFVRQLIPGSASARQAPSREILALDPAAPAAQTNLTNHQADDLDPAWSPDGSRIAFASTRAGAGYDVFVMNADGTGVTRITTNPVDDREPAWSPDSTRIAFTSNRTGGDDVWVMNADGSGQPTRLTTSGARDSSPDWSPDGARIAFESGRDGDNEFFDVFVMAPDGSGQTNLTGTSPTFVDSLHPAWSPDGSSIAFARADDSPPGIWVMAADGSGPRPLTSGASVDTHPSWQPLVPAVRIEPPALGFAPQQVGTASPAQTVTVTNVGNGALRVASVTRTGANPGDFAIVGDGCTGAALAPGQSCRFGVTFSPVAAGDRSASASVASNARGSPHTVALRGTGTAPAPSPSPGPSPEPSPTPVPAPTLVLQPPIGPPGFVTTAVGSGFPPGARVALDWEPGLGGAQAVADASGALRVPVLIFHRDLLGPRRLVARPAADPAFPEASAEFLVVAGASQPPGFVARR